jgi:hypothetical protein
MSDNTSTSVPADDPLEEARELSRPPSTSALDNDAPKKPDKSHAFVLGDYALEKDFAEANGMSTRSVARERAKPDGLPFMYFNGRVWIHLPGARAYIARRTRQPNPSRRQALTQPNKRIT